LIIIERGATIEHFFIYNYVYNCRERPVYNPCLKPTVNMHVVELDPNLTCYGSLVKCYIEDPQ